MRSRQRQGTPDDPPMPAGQLEPGRDPQDEAAACERCGGREHYSVSRSLGADRVRLRCCRTCQPNHPLVLAFDTVLRELFFEDVSTSRLDGSLDGHACA